jgi:N-acetyl-anhydromuramyl-L-alanine amidase AmpD
MTVLSLTQRLVRSPAQQLAELLRKATARELGPWNRLREERQGVMLHYTGGSDLSGVRFLLFDPSCQVSYNWLYLDDGTCANVAPAGARAFHAGACRRADGTIAYTDANSAFYGIAIAAEPGDRATARQRALVIEHVVALFRAHGWPAEEVPARLTDHAREAWPRGRKVDTGDVLSLADIRGAVIAALRARRAA